MTVVPSRGPAWLALAGGILFVLGTGSSMALRKTYDTRPVQMHVRWAPNADDETRTRLEQRHGLIRGEFLESRTWGYYLTDLSRTNIEALVREPMAEDTDSLDRQAFRVSPEAVRAPDVPPAPDIPRAYELLARSVLVAGMIAIGLAWSARNVNAGAPRAPASSGSPEVTSSAARWQA